MNFKSQLIMIQFPHVLIRLDLFKAKYNQGLF